MQTLRLPALARGLLITGAILAAVGVVLIPLPGPGFLLVALALPVLVAGTGLSLVARRPPRGD